MWDFISILRFSGYPNIKHVVGHVETFSSFSIDLLLVDFVGLSIASAFSFFTHSIF
ncbi:hypothetical protein RchiOBHm_Chr4g0416091 [Rosa chinensis]|uniref:Uncharacterized protein n=1 Tax=Rosa chinensis TaxID=74649 RepID=A0A2P6QWT2_ROSCH|nr:hypothetical protein RchiOBHm_Chr4g0416091 [Rosa chinensis]